MNPQHIGQPVTTPDEIDRLIAAHFDTGDQLAPSSGFASSVMQQLHAQSDAPPPFPFPWGRVVPGMITIACALAGFGIFVMRRLYAVAVAPASPQASAARAHALLPIHLNPVEQALCWTAASACLSLAVAAASIRLTGTRKRMRI